MTGLKIDKINSYYGESHILYDVSMDIGDEELVSLIGKNGAGKTTTIKSIMGIANVKSGKIIFKNEEIQKLEPDRISQFGISSIPENRGIFPDLTVEENLRLGHLGHNTTESQEELFTPIFEYFPRLEERREQRAGTMSGGERQMLSIGRALVSNPEFLLVDEPTEGLMPSLVDELRDILVEINNSGVSILLVEQNFELAFDISDYTYIIDEGKIEIGGKSKNLLNDEEVREKYLTI